MAETTGKRPQKKNNQYKRNKNPRFKNDKNPKPVKDEAGRVQHNEKPAEKPVEKSTALHPVKLKAYEIYIITAVIVILALIGYTISRNSLPQAETDGRTEEAAAGETRTEPQNILGFTELKDQYALCANLLFLSQYDSGNESASMDILRIANQKYQRLTGEMIEENPAMQAEEMEILRKIVHDEEHPEAKQALVKDCTEAIAAFEEIYNRQEIIDASLNENAGD